MKPLYIFLGTFFVFLGILGAILPVMPSTVFFIIAAYFYARSSKFLYRKLLELPYIGKHIELWEKHKAMPKSAKRMAITFTVLGTLGASFLGLITGNLILSVIAIITGVLMLILLIKIKTLA